MIIRKQHITQQIKRNEIFYLISAVAEEMNADAYLIGGYVRDLLLERKCKDIDIVCSGNGIKLANEVAKRIDKKIKVNVFKNFGTAMFTCIIDDEHWQFEFVGARKESYRSSSRNPVVEQASIEEDIARRDFTVNALAVNLSHASFGEILDIFGGISDLDKKILRTPLNPDITFSDDPLRMLRGIRFSTQLDFDLDENAFHAMQKNKERIKIISQERIAEELNKILMAKKPSKGFILLSETGLLDIIFPEVEKLKGVEVINGIGHKEIFYHTLQVVDNVAGVSDNLWLRWAALLHDIAKPQTKKYTEELGWSFHAHEFIGAKMVTKIFKRFRLPMNEKMEFVKKMVQLHLRPQALVDEQVTDSAIRRLLFDAGDHIDDLMTLCEADITSKNKLKVQQYLENFALVRQKLIEIEEKDKIRNWQPPIDGELIMKTFAIKPSKEVGMIKNAIREAILDGHIGNNFQEAYVFMIQEGEKMGLRMVKG